MPKLRFNDLTHKQRQIWVMRYRYRWRLTQIASELGTSKQAVEQILRRARLRAGVPRGFKVSVIRTKPRLIRAGSLSTIFDQ